MAGEKRIKRSTKKMKELQHETSSHHTKLDEAYKKLREAQEELITQEKLSLVGGLAEGIAHELRNSLNIISISIQYLHNKFTHGDEKREFTEAIMDKVEKLNSLATNLVHFSRLHTPHFEINDVHKILNRIIKFAKFRSTVQKVKVVRKFEADLPLIEIDKELMEHAFLNIIDYSFWAMPEGGKLVITTFPPSSDNLIEIKLTDTGCGIRSSDISNFFEPFFTQMKNESGLGLTITHRIIEEHKGSIDVKSELKKGTTFTIKLPVSQKGDQKF